MRRSLVAIAVAHDDAGYYGDPHDGGPDWGRLIGVLLLVAIVVLLILTVVSR